MNTHRSPTDATALGASRPIISTPVIMRSHRSWTTLPPWQANRVVMPADLAVHRTSLYHFILKRVRDPWISEDLVQETLARLLAYARAQTVLDVRALGFRIATNLVRDHFRAANRSDVQPLTEDLVCDKPAQEQVSIHRERIDAFGAALAAMPPLRREVFIRRRLRGQSYSEIADALGLTHAAVEKHVVRALEWLHQEISKHDAGRRLPAKSSRAGTSFQ